jgi:hypothetical protein
LAGSTLQFDTYSEPCQSEAKPFGNESRPATTVGLVLWGATCTSAPVNGSKLSQPFTENSLA